MTTINNLDSPPQNYRDYINADYIEVLCIFQISLSISQLDVLDRFNENKDLVTSDDFQLEVLYSESGQESDRSNFAETSEKNDKKFKQIQHWFQHLEHRKRVFADAYPFEFNVDKTVIRRAENLNEKQKLYIYFLIASSLRLLDKSAQNKIANGFELLCISALKEYLPKTAEVHLFGKNPYNTGKFTGKKYNKIKLLSIDLFEQLLLTEEKSRARDTGDAGVDIVAWMPLNDRRAGNILIFGQCACTLDWTEKQYSTSYEHWNRLILFTIYPTGMTFIPYCFTTADGEWYTREEMNMSIFLDRIRLIKLLSNLANPLDTLPNEIKQLLDEIILFQEPII